MIINPELKEDFFANWTSIDVEAQRAQVAKQIDDSWVVVVEGNLTIKTRTDFRGRPIVQIFFKKRSKPIHTFYFQNEQARASHIAQMIESDRKQTQRDAEWKAEQKVKQAQAMELMQVGTLLHYSWGYDQTNCEFYQVIERKPKSVVIARINGKKVEGSDGMDSCRLTAVKDSFTGEAPMVKMIKGEHLNMEFGLASICDDKKAFYSSWYA